MSENKNNAAITASLLAVVVLWGGNNAGTKWLVAAWPPIFTGATRFLCAGAILFAAEAATATALDAIQVLGGNGYINDYPTGRLLRDAKLYEIGAGTSEIRRVVVSRALVGAWKK